MPVNTTASVGAYALNVTLVGFAGTFLGMPVEALILGAAGGAISLGRGEVLTRGKAVSTIIASMMLAGTASPLVVAWLSNHVQLGDPTEEALYLKALVPFAIGSTWQWLLPRLTVKLEMWIQQKINITKGDNDVKRD